MCLSSNALFILIPALLILTSCSKPKTPEEIAQKEVSIADAICSAARIEANKLQGQDALANWDIETGKSASKGGADIEREIRAQVSRETGLLPSHANGWKAVTLGKAKTAEHEREQLAVKIPTANDEADTKCADAGKLRADALSQHFKLDS